jgi:glucokinase
MGEATGGVGGPRTGIDLGGTKIQVVIVDERHEVLGEDRRPTPTDGGPERVASAMAAAVRAAAEAAGVEPDSLSGVGVGSPGEIDAAAGTVAQARNLPDWEGSFALGPALERELGKPVRLGNDVQVATDAEARLGAGRDHDSLLGVFWGTGVGGGIVLDGKPWVGRGAAGEIGHVVIRHHGRRCPCGRHGCMEAYAGRAAMEARARELHERDGRHTDLFHLMRKHGKDRLTSGIWARALRHEDGLATEIVDEAVEALGAGVASAVNVLDVEAVVVGGGLGVRLGDPYRERIVAAMAPHVFSARPPAVHLAALGDLGGAVGAALLVADGSADARPGSA